MLINIKTNLSILSTQVINISTKFVENFEILVLDYLLTAQYNVTAV